MPRIDRRLLALVVGGVFLLVVATLPGHLYSVDGLAYYRTATTLAWDGSLIIDPPLVWGSVRAAPVWPVGFSLAFVPPALLLSPLREFQPVFDVAVKTDFRLLYGDPVYAMLSWVNGLIVALCAAATVLLAAEIGMSRRIALLSGLAAVLASPLFFYAHADFAQPLSTLLLVVGTVLALRARRRSSPLELVLLATVAAWAVATRFIDGSLSAAVWAAVLLWPHPRSGVEPTSLAPPRARITAVLFTLVGAAAGITLTMLVNWVRRGNALDFGYNISADQPIDPLATTLAYLISPGRGVPWHFPLVLLAPIGAVVLLRSGRRVETLALVLPIALFGLEYAFWVSLGDVSYGPRFLVPILPLIAILAGASLTIGTRTVRWAFVGLAAIGAVANVSLLLADQLQYWFVRGDNHVATPGFWRQFDLGAYAPVGSLRTYHPSGLANLADIVWLRLSPDTGRLSVVLMLVLAAAGFALISLAMRQVRERPDRKPNRPPDALR